jgi:hypothetical protein
MSLVVHTFNVKRKSCRIAGALKWVISPDKVRTIAQAHSATHFVTHMVEESKFLGLYTPTIADTSKGKLYSLSMLFLAGIRRGGGDGDLVGVNAVLMMQPQDAANKRCLVFVEYGQITRDSIESLEDAIVKIKEHLDTSPGATVFLQHPELGCDHQLLTWDEISGFADSDTTVLLPVPMSPYTIPASLLIFAVIAGYFVYDELVAKPASERAMAAAKARNDQTPAYLTAVDTALSSTGWDPTDLAQFVGRLQSRPLLTQGWALESMQCDMAGCKSQWGRMGGVLSTLIADLPDEKVLLTIDDAGTPETTSTLNKTFSRRDDVRKAVRLDRADLKSLQEVIIQTRPTWQTLSNAGIGVVTPDPRRWAVADLTGVKAQAVLVELPLELTMPLWRIKDVLPMLPSYLLISGMAINVSETKISVTLKGAMYAHQ